MTTPTNPRMTDVGRIDFTWTTDPTQTDPVVMTIDRADPVIEVTKEVIDHIRRHHMPFATLDDQTQALTITGDNREVIYRVGNLDTTRGVYRCEWPD